MVLGGERVFGSSNAINAEAFAFDNDKRQRIREELSLAEDDVVLGFVGRLEPVKNPFFALEVIEKCKQRGLKAKLLMLGDGNLKTEIQKRISEKGLSDSVELIGYTPRVSEFLSAMDIYLMPSFSEAFSISAIEAQTNGLPVLFSDRLSREMQILQNCRFIKLDADSFAAAIEKIRAENREGASEGILESIYNISHACEELLKIYEKSEVGAKA
jgi:glycosyltransferase involved in cell wall biosynthesis